MKIYLKKKKLLSTNPLKFKAKLQSVASTTINIKMQPETILYPWQQKYKEVELEEKRYAYRQHYERYLNEFASQPKFALASAKEIDVHVAARAIADIADKLEVQFILAQSNTVRSLRDTVTKERSWSEYTNTAREYVNVIYNEAHRRLNIKADVSITHQ